MPRTACVLLVLALLSGCIQEPAGNDVPNPMPPAAPASVGFAFDPARSVAAVANRQHEAFLAVSPDGRVLLTCAHGDFKEPANMFASTDGGATFRELVPPQPMLPAGDCEVALAPDGTWTFAGKTELGIAVASTSDEGATWRVNHLAGPPLNGLADRQWLAYAGNTLLMTYQPGTQKVGPILFTRSTDHGSTWSEPSEVAGTDAAQPAIGAGDFVVAQDGVTAYFVVSREIPAASSSYELLATHDAGASWERTAMPVQSLDAYPSVPALTPDGQIVWAYRDLDALMAVWSADDGQTWSSPLHLADGMGWPRLWCASRPDGLVDVAWMSDGTQFDRPPGLSLTRFDPALGAVAGQAIIADIGFLEYAGLAHDATGRAHAVVMDAPSTMGGDISADQDGDLLYAREAFSPT